MMAERLTSFLWIAFLVYWALTGLRAKKTVRGPSWAATAGIRVAVVLAVYVVWRSAAVTPFASRFAGLSVSTAGGNIVGLILCICGLAFAVWARRHIGRNWGMPMTLKENPALVTTGPYALVRHPIYTGWMAAMVGSALIGGGAWFVPLIILFAYFVYSARQEERLMLQTFPNEYPAYMSRTKMLVPFVF